MIKVKSFLTTISRYLLALTILITIILAIFLFSSYIILKNEIEESSNALLTLYVNDFENTISKMDNYFTSIAIQDEMLAKIKSDDENIRTLAARGLHNYMQGLITDNEIADIIVVYSKKNDICLDVIKQGLEYNTKNALRDYTKSALGNKKTNNQWSLMTLDNQSYLYKMLINDGQAIAIYLKADHLLNYLDLMGKNNRIIGLVGLDGNIGKIWGESSSDIITGSPISEINTKAYFIFKQGVQKTTIDMYCYVSKNGLLKQINRSVILVGVVVSLTLIFLLYILRYVKKEIAMPMHHMIGDMRIIKRGEYQNRIEGKFKTEEFLLLQQTTNKMIDEIIGLKITSYEKKIELQEIELKSIRLQLKPHFFLNALSTISGLSVQSKNDRIIAYIGALSKNIRYMFRAGIHTVSISEEITHVKNYIEMQELKYPGCIFELIDLPKELEEWRIPQMIIHTFVENIYKYAISLDHIITLLIKIRKVEYLGETMLIIEIEDDGKGYPTEMLKSMENNIQPMTVDGSGVGVWSIKRMMEIMYEREHLLVLGNKEPHGCFIQLFVPEYPKHEVRKELI